MSLYVIVLLKVCAQTHHVCTIKSLYKGEVTTMVLQKKLYTM